MRPVLTSLAILSILAASLRSPLVPVSASLHIAHRSPKTKCKYVSKQVHGKLKRVKVCRAVKRRPTPTRTPLPPPAGASPTGTSTSTGVARAGGVNVSPAYRPWRYSAGPEPDSWWCKQPDCNGNADPLTTITAELNLAKRLNVANVRLEFPWPFIEPQAGVYDWTRADAIVRAASSIGVQLEPVLVWTPRWAAATSDGAPTAAQFGDFVRTIVSRYKGRIHDWEMWNEPDDTSKYWSTGVASYARTILIPGYQAVRSTDPSARVILGGTASADIAWFDGIYDNGGGSSFDILAFHDYGGGGSIPTDAKSVHGVLVRHGQSSKPIWLGEYGLQENSVQDTQQQSLIKAVLTSNMPIAMAQWYALRDTYAMACCPPSVAAIGYWGLVGHDGTTIKNGYSTMQRLLGG